MEARGHMTFIAGKRGLSLRAMEDLGPPVAHLALEEGVPVYDRSGRRIGVVDMVIADEKTGIFDGVIVHTRPLSGRHLYADHDEIAELRERGVLLSVDRDALHELRPHSARRTRSGETSESPLEARLRRAWDRISGLR
jgi:sporulation protein YlmC with PRC-barrel domain